MSIWQRRQDLNLHTDCSTTHGLANRSLTIRVTSLYLAESQRIELCRLLHHPGFQDLFLTIRVLSMFGDA